MSVIITIGKIIKLSVLIFNLREHSRESGIILRDKNTFLGDQNFKGISIHLGHNMISGKLIIR